jgi:hypothetical protein
MPTCVTCGLEVGTCEHSKDGLHIEIDLSDPGENKTELIDIAALKEASSIGELFDPEHGLRAISSDEAVAEARVRVIKKLSTMTGRQVVEMAVRQMLLDALGSLRHEGADFPPFEFDVEVPLRRASFFVRVRKN